jgi:hypothetical protein
MKYIKRFNENLEYDDVNDILLDLSDNNIEYEYEYYGDKDLEKEYYAQKFLKVEYKSYFHDLIIDTINRLSLYLNRDYRIGINNRKTYSLSEFYFEDTSIIFIFYEKEELELRKNLSKYSK